MTMLNLFLKKMEIKMANEYVPPAYGQASNLEAGQLVGGAADVEAKKKGCCEA